MILHYMIEHGYLPPYQFVEDCYTELLAKPEYKDTLTPPIRVGYLEYPQSPLTVGEGWKASTFVTLRMVAAVSRMIRHAREFRTQTRGMTKHP